MYKILIVEDDIHTCDQLAKMLLENFPDVKVDPSAYAEEAIAAIKSSVKEGTPYNLAILDFRIPQFPSEESKLDESVCETFRKQCPEGVVIHYSGYPKDPAITAHIERAKNEVNALAKARESCAVIGKDDPDWIMKLRGTIEPLIYRYREDRIEANFEYLFSYGRSRSRSPQLQHSIPRSSARSLTHEMAAFIQDVEKYWSTLSIALQNRIQDIFEVKETPDGITLMLAPRELRGGS